MIGLLFGRKNILKTALISTLIVTFIWLGFWQIGRHRQRLAANERLRTQIEQPPFLLNTFNSADSLSTMKDQQIRVIGRFDFSLQKVVKNQVNNEMTGIALLAPFVLEGTNQAILVNRGWVEASKVDSADLSPYDEPLTEIEGTIQLPNRVRGSDMTSAEIFAIELPTLDALIPYDLFPVYVQQSPLPNDTANTRPLRATPTYDLSIGSHLGYTIQWFSFAIIFLVGYIAYLRRTLS